MLSKFGRYLLPIFIIAVLFTLLDAFITFNNLQNLKNDEDRVEHSREYITRLEHTLSLLIDVETGQRGYLLTDDKKFLAPYTSSIKEIGSDMSELEKYAKNDPKKANDIALLKETAKERLVTLKKVLQLHNNNASIEEMLPLLNLGKEKMDVIRSLVSKAEKVEEQELNKRIQQEDASEQRIYLTLGISTLFSLFLIYVAYFLIKRELDTRRELENRKDEFISLASHELKTPLTSMKLFTEILQKRIAKQKDKDAIRYVGKLEDQILRLTDLVKDLLDLSRIQTGKLELKPDFFDINELIDDIVESLKGTTSKHTFTIRPKLSQKVYGDRYRIYQVITNLLTNAIKYSPKGGIIVIETKKQGSVALIGVKDQGLGIAEEHQERIFERLYRIRDQETAKASGLGIGLSISAEIIKRHGGEIWVKSKKGKGSTFYFTLPLEQRPIS